MQVFTSCFRSAFPLEVLQPSPPYLQSPSRQSCGRPCWTAPPDTHTEQRMCTFLLHSMCCAACRSKQPTDRRKRWRGRGGASGSMTSSPDVKHGLGRCSREREKKDEKKEKENTQCHQFSSATWCGASRRDEVLWRHRNHFPRSTQTQQHFHNRNIQLHCGLWHVNSPDSHPAAHATPLIRAVLVVSRSPGC